MTGVQTCALPILEYKIQGDGIKENIIVKEKSEKYVYEFMMYIQGLGMRLSEEKNRIELFANRDGIEDIEYVIPVPYMYDAKGEMSDDIEYDLECVKEDQYKFSVIANEKWMNDENRVFPVTIDPQLVTNNIYFINAQVECYDSFSGTWFKKEGYSYRVQYGNLTYRTKISINKKAMVRVNEWISCVKLVLFPETQFCGYLYVGGKRIYYNSEAGPLITDITDMYHVCIDDKLIIYLELYKLGSLSFSGAEVELEYITNQYKLPCKRKFELAGGVGCEMNLAIGENMITMPDVSAENSVMGLDIFHTHKRSREEYFVGDQFRLSLHEKFEKYNTSTPIANYVYTDGNGDKHGFTVYYYYINVSGVKTYVDKEQVEVELDGRLKYLNYDVQTEYRSATGLSVKTQLEGFKNIDLLEQRSDDEKQLEEQVNGYKNAYEDFVLLNTDSGTYETINVDEIFKAYGAKEMPVSKGEALQYMSLLLQKESLLKQKEALEKQKESTAYTVKNPEDIIPNATEEQIQIFSVKSSIYESNQALLSYIDNYTFTVNINSLKTALVGYEIIKESTYGVLLDDANYSKETGDTVDIPVEDLKSRFRQRNLLVEQLKQYTTEISKQDMDGQIAIVDKQIALVDEQLKDLKANKDQNVEQLQTYYKEYVNLLDEQKTVKKQIPVNFLTDQTYTKGYNENGDLVMVFDEYENYAVIEYEKFDDSMRIARIYDNENRRVEFTYQPNGLLSTITDIHGNVIYYTYSNGKLIGVKRSEGQEILISYNDEDEIVCIEDLTRGMGAELCYSESRLQSISNYTVYSKLSENSVEEKRCEIKNTKFSYVLYSNGMMVDLRIASGETIEKYVFDSQYNCKEYYKEVCGVVTEAEQYYFRPFDWVGETPAEQPGYIVKYADINSLNIACLDDYQFVVGYSKTIRFNEFNGIKSQRINKVQLSGDGNNRLTNETTYTYDNNHRVIKERTEITTSDPRKGRITYKKYAYDAYGNVVRTESYVEGEEKTRGKTIEETVYDDKGNVIKSFTYNSLDSSSKFYTETEYDENGKTIAGYDETGEQRTKYRYVNGRNWIAEETLPNGSKYSYGYDAEGVVTGITQSTAEGEDNSTQKAYTYGALTRVQSGNTVVDYVYDGKRRVTQILLNGAVYKNISYVDDTMLDDVCVDKTTETDALNNSVTTYTDKFGKIVKQELSDGTTLVYTYNARGNLISVKEKKNGVDLSEKAYTYDGLGNMLTCTEKCSGETKYTETDKYDSFGRIVSVSQGNGSNYGYTYKSELDDELTEIAVDGMQFVPSYDVLGRNKGRTIYVNGKKVSEESIAYRKVSDHTTNMPSTVWFGNSTNGSYQIKDSIRYAYDKMGNIEKVYNNGELVIRYAYDALNRLVREDNKTLDKTYIFVYDNNGNIVKRREFAFTLRGETFLEEQKSTDKAYVYNGDQMLSYNVEPCVYDEMGNPTTYRGKTATWEYGRRLASYDGHTFTYDVQGRRLTKDGVVFAYDSNGRLIKQDDMEFFYDNTGVAGVKYDNKTYVYRKDAQGNVIALLDESGVVVAKYVYDAWGNHRVLDANGVTITDVSHIANLNPFRYRGYYYDTETKLYFLKTRYYDPEIGRFMTIDDISYLDPETINGLNLYAYCLDNPIMYTDPNGTYILSSILIGLLIGAIVGAVAGGVVAGVTTYNNGARGWELVGWTALGVVGGAVVGGAIGAGIGYIAPTISSALSALSAFLGTTFTIGGATATGGAAISITGAQISAAGLAALMGMGIMFSKNADRFGKSKLGSNSYYNKQFDDFWNKYGNGNKDTRRSFHDFITKKGYDTWKQLLEAWNKFISR